MIEFIANDEGVWCGCGHRMRSMVGNQIRVRRQYLWWECEHCGKATDSIPLPLRRRPDMALLQGDPLCDPSDTTTRTGPRSVRTSSRVTGTSAPSAASSAADATRHSTSTT